MQVTVIFETSLTARMSRLSPGKPGALNSIVNTVLSIEAHVFGLYWDNVKENGNYYLGFRVQGYTLP